MSRSTKAATAGLYRIADKAGRYTAVRSTALPILEIRTGPVDRDSGPVLLRIQPGVGSDRGAGAEDIGTGQFGQHDASQGFSPLH